MRHARLHLIFFAIIAVSLAVSGCSASKTFYHSAQDLAGSMYDRFSNPLYKKAKPVKDGLKKRIMLLPITDNAGLGDVKTASLTERFQKLLESDGQFLVRRVQKDLPVGRLGGMSGGSPQVGVVIDPDLAKIAEEQGMNVLITAVLNPFEVHVNRWGFWPVQRKSRELEISMTVNVLDVTNGTLFLSHLESRKEKLPKGEDEVGKTSDMIGEGELEKVLSEIVEAQVTTAIAEMKSHPWTGRVITAGQKQIIINAGRDVGLDIGSVFDVFEKGDPIRAANGTSLYLLGEKVGEIKTVDVMERYASAVPLSGSMFRAGQVVKIRR